MSIVQFGQLCPDWGPELVGHFSASFSYGLWALFDNVGGASLVFSMGSEGQKRLGHTFSVSVFLKDSLNKLIAYLSLRMLKTTMSDILANKLDKESDIRVFDRNQANGVLFDYFFHDYLITFRCRFVPYKIDTCPPEINLLITISPQGTAAGANERRSECFKT